MTSGVVMRRKEPLLGIFWIVAGRIVAFTTPVSKVESVGGFKDSKFGHYHVWQAVVRKNPKLSGKEYWERPRGRVVYAVADDQFRLFLPSSHAKDQRLIRRIAKRYSLPIRKVKVWSDQHYEPPPLDLSDED
jgi:hypothetical protein